MFYIGCPIWGYKGWVGNFFPSSTPQSNFLQVYSRKLTTVEGNTTFYATPSVETIAHWRNETPPEFRFCPKISRDISHKPHLENLIFEMIGNDADLQHGELICLNVQFESGYLKVCELSRGSQTRRTEPRNRQK